jgi:hypothetical protein
MTVGKNEAIRRKNESGAGTARFLGPAKVSAAEPVLNVDVDDGRTHFVGGANHGARVGVEQTEIGGGVAFAWRRVSRHVPLLRNQLKCWLSSHDFALLLTD